MKFYYYFPNILEQPTSVPEPMSDSACDGLFDTLDTLRHEAFALQNQLFKATPEMCADLERLLLQNRAKRAVLRDDLSQRGYIID